MEFEEMLGKPYRPVLCHKCPVLDHCTVKQLRATKYLAEHEGALIVDDEPIFVKMWNRARSAAEQCPLLKLLENSRGMVKSG